MYSPQKRETALLATLDGETVLQGKNQILRRFAEHLNQLLNIPGMTDQNALGNIKTENNNDLYR